MGGILNHREMGELKILRRGKEEFYPGWGDGELNERLYQSGKLFNGKIGVLYDNPRGPPGYFRVIPTPVNDLAELEKMYRAHQVKK